MADIVDFKTSRRREILFIHFASLCELLSANNLCSFRYFLKPFLIMWKGLKLTITLPIEICYWSKTFAEICCQGKILDTG